MREEEGEARQAGEKERGEESIFPLFFTRREENPRETEENAMFSYQEGRRETGTTPLAGTRRSITANKRRKDPTPSRPSTQLRECEERQKCKNTRDVPRTKSSARANKDTAHEERQMCVKKSNFLANSKKKGEGNASAFEIGHPPLSCYQNELLRKHAKNGYEKDDTERTWTVALYSESFPPLFLSRVFFPPASQTGGDDDRDFSTISLFFFGEELPVINRTFL